MLNSLTGATRVYVVVGDPITQVKSPNGVTGAFAARGHDAVLVPMHVGALDVDALIVALGRTRNVDGMLVTVPHKFAAHKHCATASERSHILTATNILRRNADGSWDGDMVDGPGFVKGVRLGGFELSGKRALLVGAGGAGSAIGLELLRSGVAALAVHDSDVARRDRLLDRLRVHCSAGLHVGSDDPSGFDLVVNATPAGMRDDDAVPVQLERLRPEMFVGDVITVPEVTPLLYAARRAGCRTSTGVDMFNAELDLQLDFFLGPVA
ncbi:MAG: shikimate dehydrogenase [Casimicrobiaceae bacterium]